MSSKHVLCAFSWWSLLFVGLTIVFPIVQGGSHKLLTSHGHRGKQAVESVAHVDKVLSARLRESAFFPTELASKKADASGSSSCSSAAFATSSPFLRGRPENHASCHDLSDSDEEEKEDKVVEKEVKDEVKKEVLEDKRIEKNKKEKKKVNTKNVPKCFEHNQRNCRICRLFNDKQQPCWPGELLLAFTEWTLDESIQKTDSQRMRGGQQVLMTLQRHCQDHECTSGLLEGLEELEDFLDNIFMYSYEEALLITKELSEYVNEIAPFDANDKVQALRDFAGPTISTLFEFVKIVSPPWATHSKHRDLFTEVNSQMQQVIGNIILVVHQYFEPIVKEGRLLSSASDAVKQKRVQTNNKKHSKSKDEKVLQLRRTQWKADCDLLYAFTLDFIRLPFNFAIKNKLINPLGLIGGDACPHTSMRSSFDQSMMRNLMNVV